MAHNPTSTLTSGSLRQPVAEGARWLGIGVGFKILSELVTAVLLARLLGPADFGIVAMGLSVTGFLILFSDFGFAASIVRRHSIDERFLSSIFLLNSLFVGSIAGLLALGSGGVAQLFAEPRLTPVLQALAVVILFDGLAAVPRSILERRLRFRLTAIIEATGIALGSATGIILAFNGAGVWALVGQQLARSVSIMVGQWICSGWRPRAWPSWALVRPEVRFGLGLAGFSLINYAGRNADDVLIGRFLGAAALGPYRLAYKLMLYPLRHVTMVAGRIAFPALSAMRNDHPRAAEAYLQVVSLVAFVTFPATLGLAATSDLFAIVVLGPQWLLVGTLLTILAPVGAHQSIASLGGIIYKSTGRTGLQFRWSLAVNATFLVAFFIGMQWGVVGVAIAYAVANGILAIPGYTLHLGLLGLRLGDLVRKLWRHLACALVMALAVSAARYYAFEDLAAPLALTASIALGVVIYLALAAIALREPLQQLLVLAKIPRSGIRSAFAQGGAIP